MSFSRQEYRSGLPFPPSRDLLRSGIEPTSLVSCIVGGFFTTSATWEVPQFNSVQLLSRVRLFATPWIAACQASLSITNSQSLLRLMSVESVMPSSHLILCRPLLLLPPIPPSIRVISNESTLRKRWPKYLSFSFSIRGQGRRPRGATPHPRSGAVAERNYSTPGEVPRELQKGPESHSFTFSLGKQRQMDSAPKKTSEMPA